VVRLLATERGSVTKARPDNPIAVGALQRKRAEIAGIIAELEKQIAEHRADLVHIDNALRLMNSPIAGEDVPARKPRLSNKGYFVHGELTRRVYAALRERETISGAELADIALADKNINDRRIRTTFVTRFLVCLAQMAERGDVERVGRGNGVRWRLRAGD
jgi:hypothetical protein